MRPPCAVPPAPEPLPQDSELNLLVVARCPGMRAALAQALAEAGLQARTAASFGVLEVLLGASTPFDAVVVAQTLEESTLFGVPQLIRSFDPDVPVLVLESDTVASPGTAELVQSAALCWPLRERGCRAVH